MLDGGMTTLRSGFRLPINMFPPGGGGDFVGITFPSPFPLLVPRSPGEPLGFTKPFPVETHRDVAHHETLFQSSDSHQPQAESTTRHYAAAVVA